jgi:phosphoribosylformylglycinamidine cyclo-ligase
MVKACLDTGVSLVGGETAEMPDTYLPGEHDLVFKLQKPKFKEP